MLLLTALGALAQIRAAADELDRHESAAWDTVLITGDFADHAQFR